MAAKKTTRKGGLGRGLDALVPPKNETEETKKTDGSGKKSFAEGDGIRTVDINKVEPNRDQPRKNFNEDSLSELSDSIRQYGILVPIMVQQKNDYYMIIAGERRWRAAKMAGLKEVPVLVRNYSDQKLVEVALIDNIQREDLNPIEEALAFKNLLEEFHLKQDEVAERVSKSRTAVTNSMRLLKLDERVQQMLVDDMISTGHARAILAISDPDEQYEFAQRIFDEKMSVREVEKEIKNLQSQKGEKKKTDHGVSDQLLAVYGDLEEKLKNRIGSKVAIRPKDDQHGKIEIEYFSSDEMKDLVDRLQSMN